MSPELLAGKGKPDGAADQYSLGVIAYEMLTGKPPFDGASPMDIMIQHYGKKAPPAAPLEKARQKAPRLADIVLRMLQKRPVDRFPSLGATAHALRHALASDKTAAEVARASYERCIELGYFLDTFYERFIGNNPSVKKVFTRAKLDMDRQIRVLDSTLRLILDHGLDSDEARERFKPFLPSHQTMLDRSPELFEAFEEALVSAVQSCDVSHTPNVESAWRRTVRDCVDYIRSAGAPSASRRSAHARTTKR